MSTNFCFQKFVDNAQQCFAFTPQGNFSTHNLNFYWRWSWWDRILLRSFLLLPEITLEQRREVIHKRWSNVGQFYWLELQIQNLQLWLGYFEVWQSYCFVLRSSCCSPEIHFLMTCLNLIDKRLCWDNLRQKIHFLLSGHGEWNAGHARKLNQCRMSSD